MIYNLYSVFDIKYVSPLWHKANTKALGLSNKVAHISKLVPIAARTSPMTISADKRAFVFKKILAFRSTAFGWTPEH